MVINTFTEATEALLSCLVCLKHSEAQNRSLLKMNKLIQTVSVLSEDHTTLFSEVVTAVKTEVTIVTSGPKHRLHRHG